MPAETHTHHAPIDRESVERLICGRLGEILETDPGGISGGDRFTDDLGADSLALIELVEFLEEELGARTAGFSIDDDDLAGLHTVADAVDYVLARLG